MFQTDGTEQQKPHSLKLVLLDDRSNPSSQSISTSVARYRDCIDTQSVNITVAIFVLHAAPEGPDAAVLCPHHHRQHIKRY